MDQPFTSIFPVFRIYMILITLYIGSPETLSIAIQSSGNPTKPDTSLGYCGLAVNAVTVDPLCRFLPPTFSPPQRHATAELEVLLTHLPDTVLEQFQDEAHPLTFHSMQADVQQSLPANLRTKHPQPCATGRPKQSKKMTADEMELDGVGMISLEVPVEPDIKPDVLNQGNDVDASEASQYESGNLDVDGKAQQQSKIVKSTAVAPELSDSGKKMVCTLLPPPNLTTPLSPKHRPKAWSIRYTDDQIHMSFEFLAQFHASLRAELTFDEA
ncbi:hypothetical protein DFH08DRAFT_817626 [Mycena albidolilacea]|uniref:Uncharacterized protein n=1 Tax=Mycena albidolilacea TaxID=1033008 RepID=A0AAD6ZIJ1_9AGAR|nr:hypothetical protein DFH08DRAFT_817626 [Mycena albidolilacea]